MDKSINEVAIEASLGVYGSGSERDEWIESLGYSPKRVQKIINRSLKYGLPDRDVVLGKSTKSAKTSDGKTITYTDIWDLMEKTKKHFESTKKLKNLANSKKYVTITTKDSKGKTTTTKIYYKDIVGNLKTREATTQNSNNSSWDASSATGVSTDKPDSEGVRTSVATSSGVSTSSSVSGGVRVEVAASKKGTTNPEPSITFYIKNMLNGQIIYLPTYPEDVSESYSTNYSQTDLNGRSAPYQTYGGNEARSISLSTTLYQDLCDSHTGDLSTIVMYLKQLVYPKYNGSIVISPYCFLKFGDMLNCYALMESIDFSWGDTIIEDSNHFSKCEVNFSFQELRRDSLPTVDNVFKGGKDSDS